MARKKRHIEVSEDIWKGLKNLSKRYDAPMVRIADEIFDNSDKKILDEIFGKRRVLKENI